jgi:class 3 adenylate cyclase
MDYFGSNVTRAAKLAEIAAKGTILLSPELYAKAMSTMQRIDPFVMKSKGGVILGKNGESLDVYEVSDTSSPSLSSSPLFFPLPPSLPSLFPPPSLSLKYIVDGT